MLLFKKRFNSNYYFINFYCKMNNFPNANNNNNRSNYPDLNNLN